MANPNPHPHPNANAHPTPTPTPTPTPNFNQVNNVAENVRIANDLTVHGEAWKMGGSAQWRVLSDERVKDVLGDFTLGGV